jgi:YHS domain-containing protein
MLHVLFLAWVIYILYRWLRRGAAPAPKPRNYAPPPGQAVEEMVQDPLCGTWVPLGQAVLLDVKREKHYFCSPECRDRFLAGQRREK